MATFKSVVTKLGQVRIAAAIQSGKDINIIEMAVGDGGGKAVQPVATQTQLVKEVYRTKLNSLRLDAKNANWVIAEAIISASVGGFWMREMGLYADDDTLIAVCNMADTYKPTLAEGSGRTQTLRMVISVTDTSAVSLTIDDSLIVATEEYVNDLLAAHEKSRNHPDGTLTEKGFVQLSSATDSENEKQAATPKAVKMANDNANSRLPSDGTAVAASKLATARKIAGNKFDGTEDISISASDVDALPLDGTAVAAKKLATARKIAGVGFDGTSDITLSAANVGAYPTSGGQLDGSMDATGDVTSGPGKDIASGQDVIASRAVYESGGNVRVYSPNNKPSSDDVGALPSDGTAVAAKKLATARKIAGVGFDGTSDINLSAANVGAYPTSGGQLDGSMNATGDVTSGPNRNVASGRDVIAASAVYESNGGVRVYSPNYRPTPRDIGAISESGGNYPVYLRLRGVETLPTEAASANLAALYSAPAPIPPGTVASGSVYNWYAMQIMAGLVRNASDGTTGYGVFFNGLRRFLIDPAGNLFASSGVYESDGSVRVYSPNNPPPQPPAPPRNSLSGSGFWRCGDTGFIMQWGTVGRGLPANVTFPIGFPSVCVSAQVTQNSAAYGNQSTVNISANNRNAGGFQAYVYENEVGADWFAIGY